MMILLIYLIFILSHHQVLSASDTSLSVEAIKHNLPIGTLITFPSSVTFRLTSVANVGDTTLTGVCDNGISSGDISLSVNINPTKITKD